MNQNNMRGVERRDEIPPYSRLFVVCGRHLTEDDLRERFQSFGNIDDLYIPKDRNTRESKGVAYIKYDKTSSAAAAIQDLHMKVLNQDHKPMKVMVAVNKNENPAQNENMDRYTRLFIKVPRDVTESEIRQQFSDFGHIESVRLQRDKATEICKGFAYVQYKTFYEAAKAYEECDRKYKPVFALPRDELKRSRHSFDMKNESNVNLNNYSNSKHFPNFMDRNHSPRAEYNNNGNRNVDAQDFNTLAVKCNPHVHQKYIKKLFDIVPGLAQFQYSVDTYSGVSKALITYETKNSAAYALEKLNNYEFPSGEIITVKPDRNPLSKAADNLTDIINDFKNAGSPDLQQLANVIAQASSLIKAATLSGHGEMHTSKSNDSEFNFCSVNLPPPQPMADFNTKVAQRLFIVCKPHPPALSVLQDVFCRFGDLIHVSTIPAKTFGFVKYASVNSAKEAISTLNGATVGGGIRLKVMEADDKADRDDKEPERADLAENPDHDMASKRMRLED